MAGKLTDKQYKDLYYGLLRHYQYCRERGINEYWQIRQELFAAVNTLLGERRFPGIKETEYANLYNAVEVFAKATPAGRTLKEETMPSSMLSYQPVTSSVQINNYYQSSLSRWDDFIFFTPRPIPYYPPVVVIDRSSNTSNDDKKKNDMFASLAILGLVLFAVAATGIAVYYLLKEISHNMERFTYNEGWFQAATSMCSMAAFAFASSWFCSAFLTSPLSTLAISLGMANPLSAAMFGVVCCSILGTAAATFIFTLIQQKMLKNSNPDALDANDPYRYIISPSQEEALEEKRINPVAVKLAIIALRAEMSEEQPMHRLWSWRTQVTKKNMDTIRKLKSGDLDEVKVGDLSFDCRKYDVVSSYTAYPAAYGQPPAYNPYSVPSAPPADSRFGI
ncbi:Uncharacterised protein (plasmid) [Legionella adelaidensis]|uniref:Uncharacterized protein n=1 Tax=Legionella adelaidensis TaxID=45056 RepID=A0A0W0R304_9GAMM|nr:hypothetical protein [Legionella adelaidensis]KTC65446.1 hypothetical protein Lade_0104 [Legionella adelaidensis]VEH84733.1 Uncharacterised protein [Legionella adelaidensis]